MPDWKQLSDEINKAGSTYDVLRRRYLAKLASLTGRNTIAYYSGWLQKPGLPGPAVAVPRRPRSQLRNACTGSRAAVTSSAWAIPRLVALAPRSAR